MEHLEILKLQAPLLLSVSIASWLNSRKSKRVAGMQFPIKAEIEA
jgi:hypothetical protein